MNYEAVIFDLFGTIVDWNSDRLPRMDYDGRSFPSTLPLLMPLIEEAHGEPLEVETFLTVYRAVYGEIAVQRRERFVEITCEERFRRTLQRLDRPDDALARRLTRRHMAKVREMTAAPRARVEAVEKIAQHHRVAVLSNFDDSAAGHAIVADTGLRDLFKSVVISADLAVRKPHPDMYRKSLTDLGVEAATALFVGDTPEEDIVGAHHVGLPSVWLSERKSPYPTGLPRATYEIPDLTALPALLGIS